MDTKDLGSLPKKRIFKPGEAESLSAYYSSLRDGYVRKTKRLLIGGLVLLIPTVFLGKSVVSRIIEYHRQWDKVEASSDYQKPHRLIQNLERNHEILSGRRNQIRSYTVFSHESKPKLIKLQRTDSIAYSLDKRILKNFTRLDSAKQSKNNLPCVRGYIQYRNDATEGDLKNLGGFLLFGGLAAVLFNYSAKNRRNRICMDKSRRSEKSLELF